MYNIHIRSALFYIMYLYIMHSSLPLSLEPLSISGYTSSNLMVTRPSSFLLTSLLPKNDVLSRRTTPNRLDLDAQKLFNESNILLGLDWQLTVCRAGRSGLAPALETLVHRLNRIEVFGVGGEDIRNGSVGETVSDGGFDLFKFIEDIKFGEV